MVRLESVPNALEQAKQAAADICGRPPPPPEVPWFWSDQYDLRLQIAGLAFDAAETRGARRLPAAASFAVFHLDAAARVQAVEAVNSPPEFMARQAPGARGGSGWRRRALADLAVTAARTLAAELSAS